MIEDSFISLPVPSNPLLQRKLAYRVWGDPANTNVVLCVHGLSRNGRDFDRLAEKLAERYRVICPDMAGRGQSDWLDNKNDYNYLTYASDIIALLMQSGISSVDWVGTSMGGIIGMMLGAQQPAIIRRMVLNDIGAVISAEGLKRILGFVGSRSSYDSRGEAMEALRFYLAPFGINTEADWQFMCDISFKQLPDGTYSFAYDPGITKTFRETATLSGTIADVDLSGLWNVIQCPVLVLRGQDSDILSPETARMMQNRSLPTKLVEFPGVGHAPALLEQQQIATITDWLA